jgi:hypothetical protein
MAAPPDDGGVTVLVRGGSVPFKWSKRAERQLRAALGPAATPSWLAGAEARSHEGVLAVVRRMGLWAVDGTGRRGCKRRGADPETQGLHAWRVTPRSAWDRGLLRLDRDEERHQWRRFELLRPRDMGPCIAALNELAHFGVFRNLADAEVVLRDRVAALQREAAAARVALDPTVPYRTTAEGSARQRRRAAAAAAAAAAAPADPVPTLDHAGVAPPAPRVARALVVTARADGDVCPITFGSLRECAVAVTSCFHVFSADALATWLARRGTCPACKARCGASHPIAVGGSHVTERAA